MKTTLRQAYERVVQVLIQMQQEPGTDPAALAALDAVAGGFRSRMIGGEADDTEIDDGEPEPEVVKKPSKKAKKAKK